MITLGIVLNVFSTCAAVVAAVAALKTVQTSAQEAHTARLTARFVRWCEEPARQAIDEFVTNTRRHLMALEPLEQGRTAQSTGAEVLQSYIRRVTDRLVGSMTLAGQECQGAIVRSCQDMEDRLLTLLADSYCSEVSVVDVESEMYRGLETVIYVVLRAEQEVLRRTGVQSDEWARLRHVRSDLWLASGRLGESGVEGSVK